VPETPTPVKRAIRSFVIRSGRMTDSQRKAYDKHMARWALAFGTESEAYEFPDIYDNDNPVTLEIGFGMGDSLIRMALDAPNTNFLGIEVHQAGVGRLLRLVEENRIGNIRVVCHDAVDIIRHNIKPASVQRVNIFFPDPWHKKKHHKRRLVQADFLTLIHSRMKENGLLHIATDWHPYAEHTLECVSESRLFRNISPDDDFVDGADFGRPETKFEKRGLKLGHKVFDMVFESWSKALVDSPIA